jgi:hypothetical protein
LPSSSHAWKSRWEFDEGVAHEAIATQDLLRSPIELIRLAERYASYLSERTANPYLAWGRLGQITRALPPEQAFDLACHFIQALPRFCVASFGGGILAHLVDHHGEALIDWIEREAWRDVDFLAALSGAWVSGEGIHPTILIRLRVATGARIHIVRRPQRDAAYKAMFERWITGRPQRRIRHRKHPLHRWSSVDEPDLDTLSHSTAVARPRATTDVPRRVHHDSRALGNMARGAGMVWFFWLDVMISTPLLLPVLVAVLCLISASLVTDLIAVALAFVVGTVGGAVAGLVMGIVIERRRQAVNARVYGGVMTLIPYVTLVGLIARSEHGVFVAPAVVTVLAAYPAARRFLRRVRAPFRHVMRRPVP